MPNNKETKEYLAGKDAAINGANGMNCDFRLFITDAQTREWSRGNTDGKKEENTSNTKPIKEENLEPTFYTKGLPTKNNKCEHGISPDSYCSACVNKELRKKYLPEEPIKEDKND